MNSLCRKICRNCRCGKENHSVREEEDPASRVGRLLLPDDLSEQPQQKQHPATSDRPPANKLDFSQTSAIRAEINGEPASPLDWVPPSVDSHLAAKYIEQLPVGRQPITGSQAAVDRKRALDRQLPSHDLEPERCQSLSKKEKVL